MKRLILLLAMAVFAIIAASSCACINDIQHVASAKDTKRPVIVNILTKGLDAPGNKPEVIPRWVMLKYGTNQHVRWIIDADVGFTIEFKEKGHPFEKKVFTKKNNISGRAVADPGEKDKDKFYYYSVKVDGFEPIDPGVIIWK